MEATWLSKKAIFFTILVAFFCVIVFIAGWGNNTQLHLYARLLKRKVSNSTNTRSNKTSEKLKTMSIGQQDKFIHIRTNMIPLANTTDNQTSMQYLQTADSNVFMFSAIVIDKLPTYYFRTSYNATMKKRMKAYKEKMILVNGWVYRNATKAKCCFYLYNGDISSIPSSVKMTTFCATLQLRGTHFMCTLTEDASMIKGVSIAANDKPCVKSEYFYIKPIAQVDCDLSEVAICSKLTYGSVKAEVLLEWFEVQRLLGVKKIIAYTYKLNKKAMEVLNYYESVGFAIVFREFDFPARDKYVREVSNETKLAWNDLQIILNDCQSRLNGFKYVAVMDKDEIIVPTNVKKFNFSLNAFLDDVFTDKVAAIEPLAIQHITTRGQSNNDSKLFIGRYADSTAPIRDRTKIIYMPTRVQSGMNEVHKIRPETGYSQVMLPVSKATLHHYRSCRTNSYWIGHPGVQPNRQPDDVYNYKHSNPCIDFKRYNLSADMKHIITAIEERVIELKGVLNIQEP